MLKKQSKGEDLEVIETETTLIQLKEPDNTKQLLEEFEAKKDKTPPLPNIYGGCAGRGEIGYVEYDDVSGDSVTEASLARATGTTHDCLQREIISCASLAEIPISGQESMDNTLAWLLEFSPQDGVEGRIAGHVVALYKVAHKNLIDALHGGSREIQAHYMNLADKATRLAKGQMELLIRWRGRGQQKIVVKHVHVNEGGQAVIAGKVETSDRGGRKGVVNEK